MYKDLGETKRQGLDLIGLGLVGELEVQDQSNSTILLGYYKISAEVAVPLLVQRNWYYVTFM